MLLLSALSQDAAVGVQDLAVDEVRSMAGQEHAGAHLSLIHIFTKVLTRHEPVDIIQVFFGATR